MLVSQTPMTTALVVVAHVLAHLTVCIVVAQKLVPGVAFVFKDSMEGFNMSIHVRSLHWNALKL